MRPEFWQGKSVFLTGHTGFKGSWLSLWLTTLGAKVTGYALAPSSTPNLFEMLGLDHLMTSHIADIRDLDALSAALANAKPDIVLHLAAQPLVRYSYDNPVETYATNVMGTVHLLEAVRRVGGAQATLIVTSDKCYENREQHYAYRETDRLGGHDPYSNSKACAELVTQAYGHSFFATNSALGALASVRAGNVIGGGDWAADRLVPDIIHSLMKNEAPILRRPHSVRPWQHVLEPLSGYLTAVEHLVTRSTSAVPEAWNFAPAEADHVSVGDLTTALCKAWGTGITPVIRLEENAVHEAGLLMLDASKAARELAWKPRWNLAETVTRTVDWYRAYAEGADMPAFTRRQLEAYAH